MARYLLLSVPALLVLALAGCADRPDTPEEAPADIVLETRADSVAMQLYQAVGGPETWASVPYVRFTFAVGRGGERQPVAHHFWNRQTGAYRLEWQTAPDSQYVALFDVQAREGQVYLNGAPVDSARNAELMDTAYRRFINDTYWLLAPTKLFDPGVHRTFLPDSSTQATRVVRLSFEKVGLTPDDVFWLYIDRQTGLLEQWSYNLQSMPDSAAPRFYRWTGYKTFETPGGTVRLATRKEALASDLTIYTDELALPASVPDSLFRVSSEQ